MSSITTDEVRAIARLARLALSNDEVEQTTKDFSGIFKHFSAIGNIDTSKTPPADDASGLSNIAREDIARPNALCVAEEIANGYVQVPGVFEESSIS